MRKIIRDLLTDARDEFSLHLLIWLGLVVAFIVGAAWNLLALHNPFDLTGFATGGAALIGSGGSIAVAHHHFGHRSCDDVRP